VSFGSTAIQIFTGRVPFYEVREQVVIIRTIEGRRPQRPSDSVELGLSDSIWELVLAGWNSEPSERPRVQAFVSLLENIS
jgi:hypothetical protein